MKPSPTSEPLLAFGAHPDDIEFGCGGVIALEARAGRPAHLVVCSRGEAASNGTPDVRQREAENAARTLGATVEFPNLGGDAHLEDTAEHAIKLAQIIRQRKPGIVLAPTLVENQHPDHARLGKLAQRAARLARYGGLKELRNTPAHAISHLLFYAVTPDAEPRDIQPVYVDVSDDEILKTWRTAMEDHASQSATRAYTAFQLTRAWLNGQRAATGHAIPLFPNDPVLLPNLSHLGRGVRNF